MPNLIAYDIAGVQPMTGPTGLIFAMRSRYTNQSGTEAMFDEADTDFSGRNAAGSAVDGYSTTAHSGANPSVLNDVHQEHTLLVLQCQQLRLRHLEMQVVMLLLKWLFQSRNRL